MRMAFGGPQRQNGNMPAGPALPPTFIGGKILSPIQPPLLTAAKLI